MSRLSERDIITKKIIPALQKVGWDITNQVMEEVYFTDGRFKVRGKKTARAKGKRADLILYSKQNIPVAIIEAKDGSKSVGAGMQQALDYSNILDIPCVFSSNGDGFLYHDKSKEGVVEVVLTNNEFLTPDELIKSYNKYIREVVNQ